MGRGHATNVKEAIWEGMAQFQLNENKRNVIM